LIDVERDRFGDADTVDAGGQDAAGITGAFAGRIEPFDVEALEGVVAALVGGSNSAFPGNANGTTATGGQYA
jgi:hypothetical protein